MGIDDKKRLLLLDGVKFDVIGGGGGENDGGGIEILLFKRLFILSIGEGGGE